MADQETLSTFVSFSSREALLAELRSMEGARAEHEPLFRVISERLALKAYDRSAFVFILIELVYEFQVIYSGSLSQLLSQAVLVLSGDQELTDSALRAFEEIRETLGPEEPEEVEIPLESTSEPSAEAANGGIMDPVKAFLEEAFPIASGENPLGPYVPRVKSPEQERLMLELQEAQKRLVDLGFSTRMAIDMTLSRSDRGSVSHTLREISTLRAALRLFEALLTESQERILEEIGVLDKD